MSTENKTQRVAFIDIARFYAMVLVFYGHFIEEFMLLKSSVGSTQYKFIYSFHMILFVVLAGYVARENESEWGVGRFLRHRFVTRLVPFLFFTVLMMIPPIFFQGKFFGLVLPSTQGYISGLKSTLFGMPSFCIPSWFLLLIIGLELVHFIAFRFLKDSTIKIVIAAGLFYVAGYYLNLKLDIFNPLKGRVIGYNYFFIHEAITLYSFYLIGLTLKRTDLFNRLSKNMMAAGALICVLVVLLTYSLNKGPFNFHVYNYVVILFASHGHILLFPLTAAAGCGAIAMLARISPQQNLMVWMGQNTLILMCLNGIFYHYINPGLAKWVLETFSDSALPITISAVVTTLISLALCCPFIYLFNRYVPYLVGKPGKQKMTGMKTLVLN